MSTLGYVVVEYNQACGTPDLPDGAELHWLEDEARDEAAAHEEETASVGRREQYRVAKVVLLDE